MRLKLICLFLIIFVISLLLVSCTEQKNPRNFVYTVAFNYVVYGFTNEEVALDYIDKTVGEAKSVVSPQVSENDQIGCSVPECKAPPGIEFYTIKGINAKEAIAVKTRGNNEAKYYKCVYLKKL
jgi:hypothetical protein